MSFRFKYIFVLKLNKIINAYNRILITYQCTGAYLVHLPGGEGERSLNFYYNYKNIYL